MINLNLAHLFVEQYTNDNLLVDFVEESEFIYFRNNGDYIEKMTLREYEPTMLLFKHVGKLPLKEGELFTIPMEQLIEIKNIYRNRIQRDNSTEEKPMNVYMMFSNGEFITNLFECKQANKSSPRKYREEVRGTWDDGTPCSLNNLTSNFFVKVLDVGQGSTNLIYDEKTLTIFDCGVSMGYSKLESVDVLERMKASFDFYRKISLIISHWDCDHYNLLTLMDDKLISCFCCIFIPSTVISLTAKSVVKKIYKNCRYIRTFSPLPISKKRKIGIQPIIAKKNYELYVGEKCNSINKSGLALLVKGDYDSVVLSADHSNYQIWDCVYKLRVQGVCSKMNIVVPHHGGDCGKINIKHLSEQAGVAVVSVGKNGYKHPQQKTIDTYNNLGFEIKRTDWERKDIVIRVQ